MDLVLNVAIISDAGRDSLGGMTNHRIDVNLVQDKINGQIDLFNFICSYLRDCYGFDFQYNRDVVLDSDSWFKFDMNMRLKRAQELVKNSPKTISQLIDRLIKIRDEVGDVDIYSTDTETGYRSRIVDIFADVEDADDDGDKKVFIQID